MKGHSSNRHQHHHNPIDEMFPDGPFDRSGQMEIEEPGSNMDLTSNDKFVHSDFFNNFEDLFDEDLLD